jgi:peptidoglycan/LPS O-acetylase OafA/YrhL
MHRKNNFDFLRLLFASFVIISHSYPLSGITECDLLCQISDGQLSFSYTGVIGFFVISGYLVFQSLERSNNILDYFWKRFLRLYPALIVVLIITVVLSPFVYNSAIPFFQNASVRTYIPNNLTLYGTQYVIEGVFENNPVKGVVNGSLWTIPYEFTMYVLLSFLIIFRRNRTAVVGLLFVSFLLLYIGNVFFFEQLKKYAYYLSGERLLDLGIFFVGGAFLSAVRFEKVSNKSLWTISIFILVMIATGFGFLRYVKYFSLPIIIILIGVNAIPSISDIGKKIGDLSYGIYIYGFVVQQTLMHYFKLDYFELMICALAIAGILGYFSWHYIEKPSLKLKKIRFIKVLQ